MSRFGVDYSFAPPTVAQLKAAGVTFCCRYIGTPTSGKNLTLPEVDALRTAGIDLVANFEANSAGWMQGGRTAGVNAAMAAHRDATRLGMPPGRPIYFSADYNATFDQYKTQIRPCLEGAASVIGTSRIGIYGGLEQVDWAYRDGVAPWVWQTYAWSYGQWSSHGHIQQYRNGQTLGSGTVDYNRAVQADFGQWSAKEEDMPLTEDDAKLLLNYRPPGTVPNTTDSYPTLLETMLAVREVTRTLRKDGRVGKLLDQLIEGLEAGLPVTLDPTQLDELKVGLPSLEGTALIQLAISPPKP